MQQKRIFILISAIVLAISTSAKVGAIDLNRPHGEQEHEHEQEKENRQEYTCRMHPVIIMDHPGNCPKCGMKLVLKKRRLTQKPKTTRASRGDDRIDAPNWIMGMYSHPLGDSAQLGGRLMMSLDPLTECGRGYPLLFQSG